MKQDWQHILINIIKYGLFGFLGLLIAFNIYLGINKAVTHNAMPKLLGMAPLIVLSGSMEPAIMPGDVVVIREQPPERYKLGDVATYMIGETSYTHRIVAEENGAFVLKGDKNNVVDDTVTADKFVGKVILRVPKLGIAILFFKKPLGMLAMVALLFLIIYSEELWDKIRGKSSKKPVYD